MPTPVGAAGPVPGSIPPATAVQRPDQLGKDVFLKLLVAQLKYQNPMSPADGNEFMAQSAQFTMLERLEEISRQGQLNTAAGLLGRTVSWLGDGGVEMSGVVTGSRVDPNGAVLLIGAATVPISTIREVRSA